MKISKEDAAKIIFVTGIFFLILSISFDLIYFAIFIGIIGVSLFLYINRKDFDNEMVMVGIMMGYFFVSITMVIFLSILKSIPVFILGFIGILLIILSLHLMGYFERLKR